MFIFNLLPKNLIVSIYKNINLFINGVVSRSYNLSKLNGVGFKKSDTKFETEY